MNFMGMLGKTPTPDGKIEVMVTAKDPFHRRGPWTAAGNPIQGERNYEPQVGVHGVPGLLASGRPRTVMVSGDTAAIPDGPGSNVRSAMAWLRGWQVPTLGFIPVDAITLEVLDVSLQEFTAVAESCGAPGLFQSTNFYARPPTTGEEDEPPLAAQELVVGFEYGGQILCLRRTDFDSEVPQSVVREYAESWEATAGEHATKVLPGPDALPVTWRVRPQTFVSALPPWPREPAAPDLVVPTDEQLWETLKMIRSRQRCWVTLHGVPTKGDAQMYELYYDWSTGTSIPLEQRRLVDDVLREPSFDPFKFGGAGSEWREIVRRRAGHLDPKQLEVLESAAFYTFKYGLDTALRYYARPWAHEFLGRTNLDPLMPQTQISQWVAKMLAEEVDDRRLLRAIAEEVILANRDRRHAAYEAARMRAIELLQRLDHDDPELLDRVAFTSRKAARAALLAPYLSDVDTRLVSTVLDDFVSREKRLRGNARERRFGLVGKALLDAGTNEKEAAAKLGLTVRKLQRVVDAYLRPPEPIPHAGRALGADWVHEGDETATAMRIEDPLAGGLPAEDYLVRYLP